MLTYWDTWVLRATLANPPGAGLALFAGEAVSPPQVMVWAPKVQQDVDSTFTRMHTHVHMHTHTYVHIHTNKRDTYTLNTTQSTTLVHTNLRMQMHILI